MVVGSLSAVTDYRVRFQYTAGLAREKGFFRNGIIIFPLELLRGQIFIGVLEKLMMFAYTIEFCLLQR